MMWFALIVTAPLLLIMVPLSIMVREMRRPRVEPPQAFDRLEHPD